MNTLHTPVYEDKDIEISIEVFQGMPFIHVNSLNWSKSSYYKSLSILLDIKNDLGDIYAPIKDEDEKLQRYSMMFGFKPTESVVKYSDGIRRVWVCHQ